MDDLDPNDPRLIALLRDVTDPREARELTLAFAAVIRAGANTLLGALGILMGRLIMVAGAKPEPAMSSEGRYWIGNDRFRDVIIVLAGCFVSFAVFSPNRQDAEWSAKGKRLTAEHIQVIDSEGPDGSCSITVAGDRLHDKSENFFDFNTGLDGQTVHWPPESPQH